VDFSSFDNRSLSAITLNQDQKFSNQEIYAAKKELDSHPRQHPVLAEAEPTERRSSQLSLGILQAIRR
jgi:hypothetical protein